MAPLQIISSCLQLVNSPDSNRRARRSKRLQKLSKTCIPFSPRLAFLEPTGSELRDPQPFLSASRSNTPSMLSAITTTGVYSLTNTPSILSCISLAKSDTCLANVAVDNSIFNQQPDAIPSVNIHETVSNRLDLSAVSLRLSQCAAGKEASDSTVAPEATLRVPEPPNLAERGGRSSNSTAPTAYYSLSNSHESPDPASGTAIEKDEHEIYLDNLRRLHLGEEFAVNKDDFLSQAHFFSLMHQNDDDDVTASWELIDLRDYGWHV